MELFITLNTKCLATEISVFLSFLLHERKGLAVHILVSLFFYMPWNRAYRFLTLMGFRRDDKSLHSYKHRETVSRRFKQFNILWHFKSWRGSAVNLKCIWLPSILPLSQINTDYFLHLTKTLCVLAYHSLPLSQTQVINALLAVSTKCFASFRLLY